MSVVDQVVLVDANDEAIGEMEKIAAHHYPLRRHRASSVWLYKKEGGFLQAKKTSILLQQRSRQKIVGAEWWGNTICGNVFPGETYLECAARRLQQELGIQAKLTPAYKFEYRAYANEMYGEHEVDQVFVGEFAGGNVRPNPDEAQDILWVEMAELKTVLFEWRASHPEYPTAEQSLLLKDDELKKAVPVDLQLAGKSYTFVPWTMMMMLDERLWTALNNNR